MTTKHMTEKQKRRGQGHHWMAGILAKGGKEVLKENKRMRRESLQHKQILNYNEINHYAKLAKRKLV